jgi:hypothetical protein
MIQKGTHRALMAPVGCSSWRHCSNTCDMSAFSLSTPYLSFSKSLKIVHIVAEETVCLFLFKTLYYTLCVRQTVPMLEGLKGLSQEDVSVKH